MAVSMQHGGTQPPDEMKGSASLLMTHLLILSVDGYVDDAIVPTVSRLFADLLLVIESDLSARLLGAVALTSLMTVGDTKSFKMLRMISLPDCFVCAERSPHLAHL
eukprot:5277749-Amphidinium_carterae.1